MGEQVRVDREPSDLKQFLRELADGQLSAGEAMMGARVLLIKYRELLEMVETPR